ncbi:MAG TPA: ATP-binding protein [Gammaproteobacteria bacterium]
MMRKPQAARRQTATVSTMKTGSVRSRMPVSADAPEKNLRIEKMKRRYTALLKRYIDKRFEQDLLEVYRLGREVVVEELDLPAIAEMHHDAMCEVFAENPVGADNDTTCKLASTVLSEFLSPSEMSSRGYREASTAMRHLNEMLEDEVRRIAHAIHDGAGQYLACVHLSLYAIAKHISSDDGREELKHAHQLLDELERDLRRVSHELRPRVLENAGLKGAVEFLVDGVAKRTGLQIHIDDALAERPAAVVETALYRCIQEMLNNIVKHANAGNAWIVLKPAGDDVICEVRDDGVGFDASEVMVSGGGHQLGFLGIRERIAVLGGTVDVQSAPGEGARLRIRVPK